jgi:hypothetical protein
MHRIDNATAATSLPVPKPVGAGGYFTAGTPGGASATIVEYDWMNSVQEELVAICAAAGLALDKNNNAQVLAAIRGLVAGGTRIRLPAATTFYVNFATGNDANNGLTAGTAFKTLGGAWKYLAANVDGAGQVLNIQLADGTYPAAGLVGTIPGCDVVNILGNTAAPGNVILSTNVTNTDALGVVTRNRVVLAGMRFQCSSTPSGSLPGGGNGIAVAPGCVAYLGGPVDFANCTYAHVACFGSMFITNRSPYSISGGAADHFLVEDGGCVIAAGSTVTLNGTPNFSSQFIGAANNGSVEAWSMTFVGAATGTRWYAAGNGTIYVTGANPDTYFPGSAAGASGSGGVCY